MSALTVGPIGCISFLSDLIGHARLKSPSKQVVVKRAVREFSLTIHLLGSRLRLSLVRDRLHWFRDVIWGTFSLPPDFRRYQFAIDVGIAIDRHRWICCGLTSGIDSHATVVDVCFEIDRGPDGAKIRTRGRTEPVLSGGCCIDSCDAISANGSIGVWLNC
jgi:hypothetical protein